MSPKTLPSDHTLSTTLEYIELFDHLENSRAASFDRILIFSIDGQEEWVSNIYSSNMWQADHHLDFEASSVVTIELCILSGTSTKVQGNRISLGSFSGSFVDLFWRGFEVGGIRGDVKLGPVKGAHPPVFEPRNKLPEGVIPSLKSAGQDLMRMARNVNSVHLFDACHIICSVTKTFKDEIFHDDSIIRLAESFADLCEAGTGLQDIEKIISIGREGMQVASLIAQYGKLSVGRDELQKISETRLETVLVRCEKLIKDFKVDIA